MFAPPGKWLQRLCGLDACGLDTLCGLMPTRKHLEAGDEADDDDDDDDEPPRLLPNSPEGRLRIHQQQRVVMRSLQDQEEQRRVSAAARGEVDHGLARASSDRNVQDTIHRIRRSKAAAAAEAIEAAVAAEQELAATPTRSYAT